MDFLLVLIKLFR